MDFELPPLPYPKDALEPHISRQTLEFHYEKHHRGYLEKLQKVISGTEYAELSLEEIIRSAEKPEIFNNAAQVWNHTFYWNSMRPAGGGEPPAQLSELLSKSFGSIENFHKEMLQAAEGRFGSGYVWLLGEDDHLEIISTVNADNPLRLGRRPLLTLDVWEHAYYLDYQNRRADHVETFLQHLLNWEFIEENLRAPSEKWGYVPRPTAGAPSRRHH